jgi:Domain of unknown function (DUF2341)/Secretion system C-terminal sorting domain
LLLKSYLFYLKFLIIFGITMLISSKASAQLEGWRYELPVTISNNSGTQLTDYQVLINLNTGALVNMGYMQPDGRDIRFASNCGTGLIDYCLENYMNSDSTRIWVRISSLAPNGSTTVYLYMGNPSASEASTLSLFEGPYSSTSYVVVPYTSTVSNSQRGFRFSPNKNILVTHFGKRTPNSRSRYITLFDFGTQQIISQMQVSGGNTGAYNYNQLSEPQWLTGGHQYLLEIYQGAGDNYYYGVSTQIGPYLTYYDMRYSNNCSQNTFPTNSLPGFHYGTPDFLYYVRQTPVNPEPSSTFGQIADTNTPTPPSNLFAIAGNERALLIWNKNTEFDVERYLVHKNTVNDPYSAWVIGYTNQPDTNFIATGLINGASYYFWVKAVDRYCSPRISGFSNVAAITPLNVTNEEEVPKVFALYQNYPNPFNPVTDIKYDIANESFVKLVIYDMLGRQTAVLVNEIRKPGSYTAKWNPENVPSGVYIYKLTAGNFEKTMKMILLK